MALKTGAGKEVKTFMKKIEIIHYAKESEPFFVIKKTSGLPSAPLKDGDSSAFTLAAEIFPEIKKIHSKKDVEGGLLHRIDTDTEGLLLIAQSQEFYDSLSLEQEKNLFKKRYSAICQKCDIQKYSPAFPPVRNLNFLENKAFDLSSFFRPYGKDSKEVRPVTLDSGKYSLKKTNKVEYTTNITLSFLDNEKIKARAFLTKGYRHQVRCHLAWLGFPICGDKIYNPFSKIDFNKSENISKSVVKFTDEKSLEKSEKFFFKADGLYFEWKGKKFSFEY